MVSYQSNCGRVKPIPQTNWVEFAIGQANKRLGLKRISRSELNAVNEHLLVGFVHYTILYGHTLPTDLGVNGHNFVNTFIAKRVWKRFGQHYLGFGWLTWICKSFGRTSVLITSLGLIWD
jgi:hypothetical protein